VSIQEWGELLQRATTHTQDDQLPLRVGAGLTPKHIGVFAYVAMTCKNLAEVIFLLERYESLLEETNDARLVREGKRVTLRWLPRIKDPLPAFMQISLAAWVIFARRYTERPELIADADFTFPEPACTDQYSRIFGGKIRFNQQDTQISFPVENLDLPITYYDPDSHQALLLQLKNQFDQLKNIESNNALQERKDEHTLKIRAAVIQQITSGTTTLDQVAECLDMPTRTLQHQLDQMGTSFRKLLDDIRLELAQLYLKDNAMSLAEIAFLLGYSEQSSFNKAFKRWSGFTPGEYRKQILFD
jgi:AraC-like DNA-binding protein